MDIWAPEVDILAPEVDFLAPKVNILAPKAVNLPPKAFSETSKVTSGRHHMSEGPHMHWKHLKNSKPVSSGHLWVFFGLHELKNEKKWLLPKRVQWNIDLTGQKTLKTDQNDNFSAIYNGQCATWNGQSASKKFNLPAETVDLPWLKEENFEIEFLCAETVLGVP